MEIRLIHIYEKRSLLYNCISAFFSWVIVLLKYLLRKLNIIYTFVFIKSNLIDLILLTNYVKFRIKIGVWYITEFEIDN